MTESRVARNSRNRTRFRIYVAVGAVIAVVVLAILFDSVVYYGNVHAGVSVAGQKMSGLTAEEATARLNDLVATVQDGKITLTGENPAGESRTWEITAADLGSSIDVAGAVSAAMAVSREGNFFTDLGRRLKLYFSGVDVPLDGALDETKLNARLAAIAAEIDVPAVNAGLSFDNGEIKVVEGRPGRVLDVDALRARIEEVAATLSTATLTIPMKVQEPAIKAEDTDDAVAQAETMISAPIVLKSGEKEWTIAAKDIGTYMGFTTRDENGVSTLVPLLEAAKMKALFASVSEEVGAKPTDATFETDGEKAWVVPAVVGKGLDAAATASALTKASLKTTERTAEVALTTVEPELTTAEAEAMGIKGKLADYTTEYVGTSNRQVNVRITTQYASNVVLAPGEIYNFDEQIGPRTAERGYKTAPGIVGPGKLEDVFGGGICQVSTTLFNAAFFAGLEIVERKNHSIYISHYPKGRDATVSAGSPNLRFKNDTSHHILVRGTSDGVTTTFAIYGTDEGRKVTYTTSDFYNYVERTTVTVLNPDLAAGQRVVVTSGQTGRQLKVVRKVTLPDGTVIRNDTFVSTYPMVPQKIEVGTGTATTSTTKSTATTARSTTTTKPAVTTTTAATTTTTSPPATTATTDW